MVTITFTDRDTEKRALAFLLGRYSGHVLQTGEHLVPDAALEALAQEGVEFNVVCAATNALKGHNVTAQGNALGIRTIHPPKP